MEKNACDVFDDLNIEDVGNESCENFGNGIFKEGLAPALTKLFE